MKITMQVEFTINPFIREASEGDVDELAIWLQEEIERWSADVRGLHSVRVAHVAAAATVTEVPEDPFRAMSRHLRAGGNLIAAAAGDVEVTRQLNERLKDVERQVGGEGAISLQAITERLAVLEDWAECAREGALGMGSALEELDGRVSALESR